MLYPMLTLMPYHMLAMMGYLRSLLPDYKKGHVSQRCPTRGGHEVSPRVGWGGARKAALGRPPGRIEPASTLSP